MDPELELDDLDPSLEEAEATPKTEIESPPDDLEVIVEDEADEPDEPEAEAEAAPAEEEPDEDVREYSRKVRDRIKREQRLKEEERAERVRLEAEVKALRDKISKTAHEDQVKEIDAKLVGLRAQLIEANRDLDVERSAAIQEQITELYVQKINRPAQVEAAPAPAAQGPRVTAWLKHNAAWIDRPEYRAQTAAAIAINNDILARGVNPESDEYFAELESRLEKTVIVPLVRTSKAATQAPKPKVRTAVAGDNVAVRSSPRTSQVRLTQADLATMRAFGMDPDNKSDLQQFAAEKRKLGSAA